MHKRTFVVLSVALSMCVNVAVAADASNPGVLDNQQANQAQLQAIVQQARAAIRKHQDSEIAKDKAILASNGQANATVNKVTSSNPVANSTSGASNAPVVDSKLSDQAFSNVVRNMMPLSPKQIQTLHYMFNQSRRAAAAAPGVPPKPTSSSVVVNLSPGATPPVIRLASGFVTSVVFVDSTGAPWPIQAYDLGDPSAFNIQWNHKGNTLLVQAIANYKSGNLAVMLKGLDAPVMITLLPGQSAVDYRVDLRIPGLGPDASPVSNDMPSSANPVLLKVLDGIPPQNSQQIRITGGNAQAWSMGKTLFLRTRLTVLSPSWIAKMSSADGMNAYEMPKAPFILVSRHGKVTQLAVQQGE